jgi:hypothetical protein
LVEEGKSPEPIVCETEIMGVATPEVETTTGMASGVVGVHSPEPLAVGTVPAVTLPDRSERTESLSNSLIADGISHLAR